MIVIACMSTPSLYYLFIQPSETNETISTTDEKKEDEKETERAGISIRR